jgi:hypothetical protein
MGRGGGGVLGPVCRTDNHTNFLCRLPRNLRASASWNTLSAIGLHMGLLFACFTSYYIWQLTDTESGPYMSFIKFKLWLHHMVEFFHEIGFTKLCMFLSFIFKEIVASV